ncbi:M16 family metallopeptidase [Merismopedia glauca]|uniref:Peptidase M16 n=1 Tax=Merismopedia glauca CCAP 1448/3 TaxID=1296344 RepID=A0A2T1C7H1_9CYAN|nr:pitrilysin family protein [Merismopedia glauca]PSB04201.1 peptidase M16 [Merismopedia glauca CCAP 1448/3]
MSSLFEGLIDSKFAADICKLSSGLTVIHHYVPATPVVVVDAWVKAGTSLEPKEWAGVAHFLEHMIFKGTDKFPPGAFDAAIENTGGVTNAATSHDYAHFYITSAAQYLPETLPALGDLLFNATIPDAEYELERDVVLEEIRSCNDSPDFLGYQALNQSIYQNHPYGRPILGTIAELMQQSPQQMRQFHDFHYQPENMTVAIVGGVEKAIALELAEESFVSTNSQIQCPIGLVEAEPPITEIRRQKMSVGRLEQARLLMGWMGPGVEQLKDAYGLDLLSVLLAEGRTSRLVQDLREKRQLVQNISSGFSLQKDSSLFTISACLPTENLEDVEAVICEEISKLQAKSISPAELSRCQRLLCNDYAFSTEAPNQLASLYGYYHTIADAKVALSYPEQIKSFSVMDLQQLAQQYLSPQYYAINVMEPSLR